MLNDEKERAYAKPIRKKNEGKRVN